MEAFGGGGGIHESSELKDPKQFGAIPTGDAVFDASQYAFFGNNAVEEVELGGLEEEEEEEDLPPGVFDDEDYQLDHEEVETLESLSEVDDLAITFRKLNKAVSGPPIAGKIIDRGSRENSTAAGWVRGADVSNWFDKRAFDPESIQESKGWSSHPYPSPLDPVSSKPICRTFSYPEQQHQHQYQHQQRLPHPQQQYSSEPILIPKTSFTSYRPPNDRSPQASPNSQPRYPNMLYPLSGHQMPLSSPNLSPFSHAQLQMTALPFVSQFGGNLPDLVPPGHHVNVQLQNQWVNHSSSYPRDHPNLSNNMLQEQSHQNGLMPRQLIPQQQGHQQRLQHPFQPHLGHLSRQTQLLNHQLSSSPPMMNNFDMLDPRTRALLRGRHGIAYSPQGSEISRQKCDSGWPRFKAKYMTADEIENILRLQLAATHSNDPYVDDYYHQACLAKKSAGAKVKHHFCPTNLRDASSRTRPNTEPHPFLQVDALGRVSFSSIRRPRPLLEVESPNSPGPISNELAFLEKPLEQEPMLAARVTIEDSICLLLDVDDIDRFLEFNRPQDLGAELRQRRQVLLEGLATSLQLIDPLGKNGDTVDLTPKDDLVFLRLVSLVKGRKLVSRYLQLLSPGDELIRVVCMAIFRHLRFLFAGLQSGPGASDTTLNLARTVSACVCGMDLKALAACLASVVCSTEHPPLRPIGSAAGDGASVILKSVLDRASEILRDPHAAGNCSMPNRKFWQGSFDTFFGLLTKHCFDKYDTVMQSFSMQSTADVGAFGSDAAKSIGREMPVELLRSSLPHTNEQQRKLLADFAQRSIPVPNSNRSGAIGGM